VVSSIFLRNKKERIYPLLISAGLFILILTKVIPNNYIVELYYFFLGLLAATITCVFLLLIRFKTSLHMMGMGTILMYLICLSIHFERNIVIAISCMFFASGLVATARIFLKAHTRAELLIGLMIGMASQLLTIKFWL
jgi:hypothetical protein